MNVGAKTYVQSIAEDGYKLTCERLAAQFESTYHDNHRLRAAIGKHRERIMSLGLNKDGHGTEWDRELWSVLYDFLRPDEPTGRSTGWWD